VNCVFRMLVFWLKAVKHLGCCDGRWEGYVNGMDGDGSISHVYVCKEIQLNPFFYTRESMNRELNVITVQQDVTYSVCYISAGSSTCFGWCWHPTIRSWYSCNYSFWYWLTGSTIIHSRWVGTDLCVSYSRHSYTWMHTIHMNQFQLNNESVW